MTKRTSLLAASLLPLLSSLSLTGCTSSDTPDGAVTTAGATTGTGSNSGNPSSSVSASGEPTGGQTTDSMIPGGGPVDGAGGNAPSMGGNPTGTIIAPTGTGSMTAGTGSMTASTGTMTAGTTMGTMGTSSDASSGTGGTMGTSSGTGMMGETGGVPESPAGSTSTGGTSGGAGGMSGTPAGGGGDHSGPDCELPELPEGPDLTYMNQKLPDPFTFYDGTKVTTKAQWECRRKEILAMAAKYLYGDNPAKPDEVTGMVSGGTVSIDVKVGDKTDSFSATINGSGDVIALNLSSGIVPSGSKTLSFGMGFQNKIKTLYGMSELNPNIANAWMLDRVMDVLELNPDSGHDPTKMMVSGCSGCGKGAFLAGVFSRVPLTVIVESGGGGAANLRQAEWFKHGDGQDIYQCLDRGNTVYPQSVDNLEPDGICGPWVTSAGQWLHDDSSKVFTLPFDQHLLLASIAPRYLVHFTNNHGKDSWCHLGGTCEALSAWAAKPVFKALGVPERFGFHQYSAGHCGASGSATSLAGEMFKLAFQGDTSAKTDVLEIMDNGVQQPVSDWQAMWVDWDMDTVLQ